MPRFPHDGWMEDIKKSIENIARQLEMGFANVHAELEEVRADTAATKERVNDTYNLVDSHMKEHDLEQELAILIKKIDRLEIQAGLQDVPL